MVSHPLPSFVTGYSQLVDLTVRRGRYLLVRGGAHTHRLNLEFCAKERGNEKNSSTHVVDVSDFWADFR
jgi:hypothetical protein